MKASHLSLLLLLACVLGIGFFWGRSSDSSADSSEEVLESVPPADSTEDVPSLRAEQAIDEVLLRESKPKAEAVVHVPNGISEWKKHYRVRLSKTVIEILPDEPAGWTGDPKAVEEFRLLLDAMLLEYSLNPDSSYPEGALEGYLQETSELLAELRNDGQLLSFDSALLGSLLPHESLAVMNALRKISYEQDPVAKRHGVIPNIFQSSPEGYFGAMGRTLGKEEIQELQSYYDQAFLPWVLLKAEQDQLRNNTSSLAFDIGLLPPPRRWLPDLLPRYKELSVEIAFYERQLAELYSGVVEVDDSAD